LSDLPETKESQSQIFRILDANLNRLREALRVIEEHFRFIVSREDICIALKEMRHSIERMETEFGKRPLLENRDTATDCFADATRPEELARDGVGGLLSANFKRGQEAARVIEEYSKIVAGGPVPALAKKLRFSLYTIEKKSVIGTAHETD
jgi:hypothetical protein